MPTATGSFANMVKAGNSTDHAIKNGRIDIGESNSKPKGIIFILADSSRVKYSPCDQSK